jgi:dTDP-4-dehydrorhamnose 3,5-epimerase
LIFHPLPLEGAFLLEMERHEDERGFFARAFCREELAAQGLHTEYPQCNVSFNHRRGTLRGLHFQAPPHGEVKIVRVTAGAIFDVIVDVRPASHTFRQSYAVELRAGDGRLLYIPGGFAHGFQTLEDQTEVFYWMGAEYVPDAARGYRYDDPAFSISWPLPVAVISEKDLSLPPLKP